MTESDVAHTIILHILPKTLQLLMTSSSKCVGMIPHNFTDNIAVELIELYMKTYEQDYCIITYSLLRTKHESHGSRARTLMYARARVSERAAWLRRDSGSILWDHFLASVLRRTKSNETQ